MKNITGETEVLKPCPFCGGKAELKTGKCLTPERAYVKCTECGSSGNSSAEGYTVAFAGIPSVCLSLEEAKNRVVEQWNRRSKGRCVIN